MAEDLGRNLDQLTAAIKEQNAELKQKDSISELDKSIKALEKSDSANAAQLRQTLGDVTNALSSAQSQEQLDLAREQLEVLKDTTSTEEENRESAKRQEESNELLSRMVSGIDGLADSYDKMLDNIKPSGGLLAGLGAAALLFMDPETLFAGIKAAIDGVFAIVDSIGMFLDGDFSEGFQLLADNIGAVTAIVGTIAVLFGGRIIRLVSSMVKGVQGIVKAVTKVGGFVSRLAGRFGGLAKIFGRIFLPFTIITAAIGTITGIIDGFKEGGIIGGIEGGLTGLLNTLIGWPLDMLKGAVSWILGAFGFDKAEAVLDSFSFQDLISDTIGGIFDMVKGAFNWIGTLFTDPVAALESLAMGLIGPDGILGIITAPIDKAINWVMGLFKLGDPSRPFSLYDTLYTPIDKAITWLKGLFTDPVAALQQAWNGLVGTGGLIDIIYAPIDKAIAWIQGLFGWGNPEEPFKLSTVVKDAFKAAKEWVVGLFTWGSEAGTGEDGTWTLSTFVTNAFADVKQWMLDKFTFATGLATEGWTNLKDFVLGKFTEAKDWFMGKLTFASDMATEGWTNLKDFVSSKFTAVKTWFTGLFSWASDGLSEGWTNLTDFVKGKWTATKEWFTGLFAWKSDDSEGNFLANLFNETIEKVKTFFTDLFDFLPTFDQIKQSLTNMLPSWMRPDSIEEQRSSIEAEIATEQARIDRSTAGANEYFGSEESGREDSAEKIKELEQQLADLPQANEGGFVNAPETGAPVMLHGQEIITPLDSPQGKVLMAINDLMNAKADAGAGEYGGMGPMIVNGGSQGPSNSNNSTNISNSSYTIQQGITPDDFLKRDFLNFSY